MSLFCCPLCAAPLTRDEHSYRCPNGHSFDIAAAGYTHLLPANRKHSKAPGDDKEMVAARSAFLEQGYYLPLRRALEELACTLTRDLSAPVLLDSGCGEGWYTAGLFHALSAQGKQPQIAGVDISKFALKKAAKRLPRVNLPLPRSIICRWPTSPPTSSPMFSPLWPLRSLPVSSAPADTTCMWFPPPAICGR